MSRSAAHIISELGGPAAIAAETGTPLTTVASWSDVNFVPEWRQPALLAMAVKLGKPLSTADFPSKAERLPRRKVAA